MGPHPPLLKALQWLLTSEPHLVCREPSSNSMSHDLGMESCLTMQNGMQSPHSGLQGP